MRPQTRLLLVKPQIRLANSLGAHPLPNLLILAILVPDTAICNRVHDMDALLAHLPRQSLRNLSDAGSTGPVSAVSDVGAQSSQGSSEYDGLLAILVGNQGKRK